MLRCSGVVSQPRTSKEAQAWEERAQAWAQELGRARAWEERAQAWAQELGTLKFLYYMGPGSS